MDTKKIAQDLLAQDIVILDTETTGLDCDDQVIEIAIIDISGRALLNKLVEATKASNELALRTHGITEETLEEYGEPWSTIMPVVNAIFENRPVGMYNSFFDERMLQQTCTAHGLRKPVKHQSIDIMELANRHFHEHLEWDKGQSKFKRLSLEKCCEIAGIKFQARAHRAIVDCHATLDLLKFIASGEEVKASKKKLEAAIEYCNYPTCNCPIDKTTICGRGLPEKHSSIYGLDLSKQRLRKLKTLDRIIRHQKRNENGEALFNQDQLNIALQLLEQVQHLDGIAQAN